MQVSHGDSFGVVQTSVYTGVYILYSCIHMHIYYIHVYTCTYYTFHGRLTVTELVCVLQVDVCIHISTVCACTVRLYAHTWTYACTMYICMQVLNGFRVGVLQRLYTSTCIYRCLLYSCMHTHGLRHVQCT